MVNLDVAKKWIKTGIDPSAMSPNSIKEIEINSEIVGYAKKNNDNKIIVFQNKCSHMGDPLRISNQKIICPTHGWTYTTDGENVNICELGLRRLDSKTEQNELFIEIPTKPLNLTKGHPSHPL